MKNNNSILSGFIWRLFERFGANIVSLIVSILLAKIIVEPEIFGTIALINVFISILQVFVDAGLGSALIQKKNVDEIDFSSVFFFNLLVGCILFCILFLVSPIIASFYENEVLTPVIRVLSITFIISGLKNIQQAYVSRNMLFKLFFISTLIGTVFSAVVGIVLAFYGFGIWALVAQYLSNLIIDTLVLWIKVKWRPKTVFSFSRIKTLFSYGWKLLVSAFLDTGYNEIRSLIIGKKYSSSDLAYYDRGKQFPQFFIANINTAIDSVLFPKMSSEQNNPEKIAILMQKSIKVSTYVIMPLMVGLAVCAEPIIRIILPETWLSSVKFLRIFCIVYAMWPLSTSNLNAMKSLGRSDLFLKLEIIKKIVGLSILIPSVFISVEAIAYSIIFSSLIALYINASPNKTLLKYGFLNQIIDILPNIILSLIMGIVSFSLVFLGLSDLLTLSLQVIVGGGVYIFLSWISNNDSFIYLLSILKTMKKKDNKKHMDNKI